MQWRGSLEMQGEHHMITMLNYLGQNDLSILESLGLTLA